MKNITVSVDDETYRRARIKAAERETSLSALVKQFLAEHVAKWQVPEDVVFVDALPIGATGKVVKHQLREQFKGHHGQPRVATA